MAWGDIMDMKSIFTKKRIIFGLIFLVLVFIGNKVNFSPLVGAPNQFFTLFQFFGPIVGYFMGPIFGVATVLGAEALDFVVVGKAFTLLNLVRLTPMLFAAYYFGTKKKSISVAVPLAMMAIFIAHPIGRQVWFFSLFWMIPVIVALLPKRFSQNTFLKSLGATFTAHSVGGAAWVWTVPMTAVQWTALIPVVIFERLLFTAGITLSFIAANYMLDKVVSRFKVNNPVEVVHVEKNIWARLLPWRS